MDSVVTTLYALERWEFIVGSDSQPAKTCFNESAR